MGKISKSVRLRIMITAELMIPAIATSKMRSIPRANDSRISESKQNT